MVQATLNLANPQESDIQFEVINFSDSQRLLKITTNLYEARVSELRIVSRFQWADLQLLIQAVSIAKDADIDRIILHLPYILGARSDRNFNQEHETHYFREVIAPIINNLGARRVFGLDPHSTVVEGCIHNFSPLTITPTLVRKCAEEITGAFCIVPPDVGAEKRGLEAAKAVLQHPDYRGIIQCTKERDIATGKILRTTVLGDPEGLDCIIVDDLCDGGRTFVEVSKALKAKGAENVYLCVAHGLFSYGFRPLVGTSVDSIGLIRKVYTTNSYQSKEDMLKAWTAKDKYGETVFDDFVHVHNVCV